MSMTEQVAYFIDKLVSRFSPSFVSLWICKFLRFNLSAVPITGQYNSPRDKICSAARHTTNINCDTAATMDVNTVKGQFHSDLIQ